MAINKVVFGNEIQMDLTEDTVTEDKVLEGETFHDRSGNSRVGSLVIPVQDVEVNGESVVNSEKVAEIDIPTTDIQTAVDEFETYNGGLLSSLKVALSPNQDLHGYDSPWVGGASKNKMPLTVENLKAWNISGTWSGNTYSYGGMDFTILTDDANNVIGIDENGTTSSYPTFKIFSGTLNGSYVLCKDNARSRVYVNSTQVNDGTTDYSFTASGETYDIVLFTGAVTLNHQTVKPMLVLSTETDFTFAPYTNICPISGHTQAKVGDDGKNRFNPNSYESFDITGGGVIRYGHEFDSGVYTLINNGTGVSGYFYRIVAKDYSSYGTSVQITNNTSVNVTVDDAHFLRVFTAAWDATAENIAVIEGTDEIFVPYNGYQVTVNLGGTYYSGILDVVSGVFTPDTAGVDLGTLTWTYEASWGASSDFYAPINNALNVKRPDTQDDVANAICTQYKMVSRNEFYDSADSNIAILPTPYIKIRDSRYNDGTAFQSAMNGVMLVYELANPTPIQLSPTMVKALVGENHLSAPLDGQEITESKYRQLFTWDEVEELAQKIADSKIDNLNTSYNTTFSSAFTEARYVKKIYEAPALTALQIVLSGATSITFNHQLIFSDSQTCCELIQFGSGARIGITDVAISHGSVTFTFDSALTKAIGFRCRITNDFVS